jgi:BlaI family penicillinase repressor
MTEVKPTERELDLLKILWHRERATVREIYADLHAHDTQLAYTTVLTLLQNMERKGLVKHEQQGKAYLYCAAVKRDGTFRDLAGSFLERVFDGAMSEYVVHALESQPPTEQELDDIEAVIARHRQRLRKRKGEKQ